jgi:hypothetical protein
MQPQSDSFASPAHCTKTMEDIFLFDPAFAIISRYGARNVG